GDAREGEAEAFTHARGEAAHARRDVVRRGREGRGAAGAREAGVAPLGSRALAGLASAAAVTKTRGLIEERCMRTRSFAAFLFLFFPEALAGCANDSTQALGP